jgi:hypothetical protein
MKRHKQEINITWKKTWTLQRYKERKQEHDLDLKTKMTKYMANASFYRLKFRTIDWLINYLIGGQPLTWWLVFDIVGWLLILLVGYWFELVGNCLSFSTKKNQSSFGLLELKIWAENRTVSRLLDKFWLLRCC